ncbi:MAG: phosphoethanolamine transferase [Flavobacteriaceae bacterium]|nr:phosphoethanolamine transferase [Flavobacteriaceae bacterium]
MKILKNFYLQLLIYSFVLSAFFVVPQAELSSRFLYSITLFLFFLIVSQIHKKLLWAGVLYSLVVAVLMFPTLVIYGEPNYSFWTSVFYTDYNETISYAKVVPLEAYIGLLGLIIYTFYFLKLNYSKLSIKYLVPILSAVLLVLPVKKVIDYGFRWNELDKYFNIQPIKRTIAFVGSMYYINNQQKEIIKIAKKPSTWVVENIDEVELKKNFVIVVGESVRRDFLHNYGFGIENTPFIDRTPKIQFDNYISVGPLTVVSLTRTLALSDENLQRYELNNSIVNLAKKIGYETFWISNQGIVGEHNSPISIIAQQSDNLYFLRKGDGDVGLNHYDEEMLPLVDDIIKKKKQKPKLIVLHMAGSHAFVCDRTKGKYDEFLKSKDISCYNKSIRNLDLFLGHIYKTLSKEGGGFNLVYFSDHGQVIKNGLVRHGDSFKESYDAPLIIMGGGNELKINALRTGRDFLHLFSELNNVKTKNIERNYRFISEDKIESPKVLNGSEQLVDYDRLPSNSIQQILE